MSASPWGSGQATQRQYVGGLAEQAEEVAAQVDVGEFGFQKVRSLVRAELESAGLTDQMDVIVRELLGEGSATP